MEYCRRVKPNAVKLLDPNRRVVEQIKAASPNTIVIGRKYWADQRLSQYGEFRGAAVSLAVASGVDYMEGYNEVAVEADSLSTFARSEVSLARDLNDRGIGAAIGGFSTGYLDSNRERAWDRFGVAFDYMQSAGRMCVLHFHEYSNYLQYGVETPDGRNQWRGGWTGFSDRKETYWEPTLEGWWTLRYRKLWKQLRAAGYDNIYGLITEFGTDDINPRPGEANRKGWRDWKGTQWFTSPQCGDFVDQCLWYMWQVSHDPYILGVVDFGFATADPTWLSFDFSHEPEHLERLMQTQVGLPTGTIGGAPVSDKLADMLRAEFGTAFHDVRASLPQNPNGPNGAFGTLPPGNVEALILHHTAGNYDTTWEATAAYHVDTRKFAGIGYHIGVQNGQVYYMGDIGTARAHVAGQNHRFVGVCVAGNYQVENPRQNDLAVLRKLGPVLRAYFGRWLPWKGHRDVASTACPGTTLYAVMPTLDDAGPVFDVEGLKRTAREVHELYGIRVNPTAALFVAARARGLNAVTNEFEYRGVPALVAESYGPDRRKVVLYWRGGKVYEAAL